MDVGNAADFAGEFKAQDGRTLTFRAEGKRLSLVDGQAIIPLQAAGGTSFVSTVAGAWARFPLVFARAEAQKSSEPGVEKPALPVVEISYGPEWFVHDRYKGPHQFDTPAEFSRFVGVYRSDSPWGGTSRVYVLKGRLVVDGAALTPIGGAMFRVGDEDWSPLTAEFLQVFQGRARLLRLAGSDSWRVEIE